MSRRSSGGNDGADRSHGRQQVFRRRGANVLAAYIMAELVEAREAGRAPSFARLRENLAKPANEYSLGLKDNPAMPAAVKNKVADLDVNSDSKTLQAVMMTVRNKTALLDDDYILNDLATQSDFRFADMRKEITTVYIVIPADDTARVEKWLRLVVMSALRDLQKADANPELGPVLFLLDEFPLLAKFKPVEEAMAYARGYGIQLWPVVQHLSQLKALYGENWETFISNVDVLTSFTVRDNFTAEYLSKKAGDRTVVQHGQNVGEGPRGETTGQIANRNRGAAVPARGARAAGLSALVEFCAGGGFSVHYALSALWGNRVQGRAGCAAAAGYGIVSAAPLGGCLEKPQGSPYKRGGGKWPLPWRPVASLFSLSVFGGW